MQVTAGDYDDPASEGATSRGVCRGRSPVGDRPSGSVRKIEAPFVIPRGMGVAVADG